MRTFFEVRVLIGEGEAEIFVARLSEMGFEGFLEEEDHLLAYLEKRESGKSKLEKQLAEHGIPVLGIKEIIDRNWNAEWESEYRPVIIDDRICVRAPFHPVDKTIPIDILIEPKMSFGTAHHETTAQMLSLIADMDVESKRVMDMGCGTAVLAILAKKMGASEITAVDNDEWAYNNAIENLALNGMPGTEVIMGDARVLENRMFDIIFANINRNILLEDIPAYADSLENEGYLLLSGFYEHDLKMIDIKCRSENLERQTSRTQNQWTAAVYKKELAND